MFKYFVPVLNIVKLEINWSNLIDLILASTIALFNIINWDLFTLLDIIELTVSNLFSTFTSMATQPYRRIFYCCYSSLTFFHVIQFNFKILHILFLSGYIPSCKIYLNYVNIFNLFCPLIYQFAFPEFVEFCQQFYQGMNAFLIEKR